MNSDLPGGLRPDELGFAGPGLDQVLRALTASGTADELAGEQAALAMFRANSAASANGSAAGALDGPTVIQPAIEPGTVQPGTVRPGAAGPPGGTRLLPRSRGHRGFPRLRIAVITGAAMVGGFAAAAYAAVLPAPVQHIAYQAFHDLGVPDARQDHASGSPGGRPGAGPSGLPYPSSSGSGAHSGAPGSRSAGTPQPSAGGTSSAPPSGPAVLSAQAVGTDIPAGSAATVNGMLTLGGRPDSGVYVRLMAHIAGRSGWLLLGRAQTSAQGAVSFTTPALRRNTWLRLADSSGARSTVVAITVIPRVSATLKQGPAGARDYVRVGTTAASKGDVVLLQVLQNGTWVSFKQGVLGAAGSVTFAFSAAGRQGEEIQAVLLATGLHGEAVSPPVTVPAPS